MATIPSPTPTGRLLRTPDGVDLVLTRAFPLPVEEVWAAVTESARTARWFGPWEGDGAPGAAVRVRLAFEEGEPWTELRVEACEAPHRLVVSTVDEAGSWNLELRLSGTSEGPSDTGGTELHFVQHRDTGAGLGEIGPGWEYYLDLLRAYLDGAPRPEFEDYYPAQKAYFEELTAE
ncbi:SRPBCC family protein [Streptomyces sp. IB2014 016-6]|uniref:SRPBCC family protein n=1 Tax=Streptomyces sp. IB2014 016-6 TaxID=2517818 RepID=UPI0011CC6636|nr:SRPBCC family protein [Streptomyces sp. IB2014 016-6]TXL87886.1 SRPBCC family protein [Streptomyces sp. IB2014 016-6]